MAKWIVCYRPRFECDWATPGSEIEVPCFCICPEDEPERWIARTNPDLTPEMQEECAQLIAAALTDLLGI